MKKDWKNPELKNLNLQATKEEATPFYYDPDADRPWLCKKFGAADYDNYCKYPLNPCSLFTPITEGICNVGKCKHGEPTGPSGS